MIYNCWEQALGGEGCVFIVGIRLRSQSKWLSCMTWLLQLQIIWTTRGSSRNVHVSTTGMFKLQPQI